MKRFIPLMLALCLLLTGCSPSVPKDTANVYAMDTVMSLTAYGDDPQAALSAGANEIYRMEELFSVSDEVSDIYKLNQAGSLVVSPESAALIHRSLTMAECSGGAFDPTIGALMELWGFRDHSEGAVTPTMDDIQQGLTSLLPATGYEKVGSTVVEPDENGNEILITLEPGVKMDLGGIAKGYTSGRVIGAMEEAGAESAIVSLGGNVATLGLKPGEKLWTVAIRDPQNEGGSMGELHIGAVAKSYFVVTSGAYERYVEIDGERYHHILDPKTGYPAESDLMSVTIVAEDGSLADAMSTALFVMGYDKAVEFWRSSNLTFEMLLVTEAGVHLTPGLDFSPASGVSVERLVAE